MSSYTDETMAKLRAAVDVIEQEMAQSTPALKAAWTELVGLLALGTAPLTRECPVCHGVGMRGASRCSRCWVALEPLPAVTSDASTGGAS